jgi:2-keto-4-pentenoate hydratase/2-oxohepta-3-ene-1,7-dioic acid hydratase in catechol pathway
MRLMSYVHPERGEGVGVVRDETVVPLETPTGAGPVPPGRSPMRSLIVACGGDPTRLALAGDDRAIAIGDVTVLPPVPDPSKIVAAPVNYFDHKSEMNVSTHIDGLGVFLKAPSSLVGAGGTVRLPYTDRRFDQEGELAFVIGRTARNVTADDASGYIFGYTCLLDITMRGGEDRSTRKSFDTFTPTGPWLVTRDEVGTVDDLRLTCEVNGTTRQDADLADLIWGVPALLEYVSSVMTLQPGDIVSTGTPAGVGEIRDGDRIGVTITRVGTLEVGVDAVGAVACPTKGAGRGPVPPAELTPTRNRPAAPVT